MGNDAQWPALLAVAFTGSSSRPALATAACACARGTQAVSYRWQRAMVRYEKSGRDPARRLRRAPTTRLNMRLVPLSFLLGGNVAKEIDACDDAKDHLAEPEAASFPS